MHKDLVQVKSAKCSSSGQIARNEQMRGIMVKFSHPLVMERIEYQAQSVESLFFKSFIIVDCWTDFVGLVRLQLNYCENHE